MKLYILFFLLVGSWLFIGASIYHYRHKDMTRFWRALALANICLYWVQTLK